ncbi:hypothetical protein BH10PSE7_BH10PSE7_34110 [soil metagenome]
MTEKRTRRVPGYNISPGAIYATALMFIVAVFFVGLAMLDSGTR